MAKIIISVLAIIISFITFLWGFSKNKKLNAETKWHNVWAADFLKQSNNFNRLTSQIVIGTFLYAELAKENKLEEAKQQNEEIVIFLNKIRFYEWELRKYSQFAPNTGKNFTDATSTLFKLLGNLIEYCKNTKNDSTFDLEKIRKAQFLYSKASRDLHKELLGLQTTSFL